MRRRAHVPLLLLLALFAALTIPMAWLGRIGTSEASDQNRYHWPTIVAMSEHWPTVSLDEYRTATGPLYHAALAAVVAIAGDSQRMIRVLNAIVSLPLVACVYALVRRRARPWQAAVIVLPFVLSAYVLSNAIWIMTDNAAAIFVVLSLMAASSAAATASRRMNIWGSIFTALATAVRQIHLWTVAPVALSQFLRLRQTGRSSLVRSAIAGGLTALPAVVTVALLAWWWRGLTPPYVEARHAAIGNPFGFGFTVSLVGLFGVFYLPLVASRTKLAAPNRAVWALPVVMLLAAALTLLTPTTLNKAEGRWGGPIWSLVDHLPVIADRSVLFPLLAAIGGAYLVIGVRRAAALNRSFEATILLIALASFTVSHAVQPWCAQRYFEPIILVFVTWLASLGVGPDQRSEAAGQTIKASLWWLGPALLAAIQLALSIYAVYWQTRPADISI